MNFETREADTRGDFTIFAVGEYVECLPAMYSDRAHFGGVSQAIAFATFRMDRVFWPRVIHAGAPRTNISMRTQAGIGHYRLVQRRVLQSAHQIPCVREVGGAARVAGRARRQLGGEGGGSGRHDAAIHVRGKVQCSVSTLSSWAPATHARNEAIAHGDVWSDVGAGADGAARRERSPAPVCQKVSSPYRCTALALPRTSWLALN
jgi:hypothetical protein